MSCESWDSNAQFDVVPMPHPSDPLNPVHLYLGPLMEQYLTHPYASPLFGDFKGLPPLLVQSGDAEVLRDEITLLAHKATLAGVDVQHELYEDAVRTFPQGCFDLTDTFRRSTSFKSTRSWIPRGGHSYPCANLWDEYFKTTHRNHWMQKPKANSHTSSKTKALPLFAVMASRRLVAWRMCERKSSPTCL